MSLISVKDFKIIYLQSCAKGFRTTFYIIYNSLMNKEGCESWMQDGDGMSALAANGCFSVELYLKFLMVIDSFDISTLTGKHFKGHELDVLFSHLKTQNPSIASDLENEFLKSRYSTSSLMNFLHKIRNYFAEWRYSYDSGVLNVNLNTLSNLLNILDVYSSKKYLSVSKVLAINGHPLNNNQTILISNPDEVKKL